MSSHFETEQEAFWAGDFGNEYVSRNKIEASISWRTAIFSKVLARTRNVTRVLEIGANIGLNLRAIRNLFPTASLSAIEINPVAQKELELIPDTKVFKGSAFDFNAEKLGSYNLTFTSGVLIHINPEKLADVYQLLYECSNKYIVVNEYYNQMPVEINYRGHSQKLFKRDFAGELLDKYHDLELVDYGFQYHRDYNFPSDDCTWFLLKRNS